MVHKAENIFYLALFRKNLADLCSTGIYRLMVKCLSFIYADPHARPIQESGVHECCFICPESSFPSSSGQLLLILQTQLRYTSFMQSLLGQSPLLLWVCFTHHLFPSRPQAKPILTACFHISLRILINNMMEFCLVSFSPSGYELFRGKDCVLFIYNLRVICLCLFITDTYWMLIIICQIIAGTRIHRERDWVPTLRLL